MFLLNENIQGQVEELIPLNYLLYDGFSAPRRQFIVHLYIYTK